MTTLVWDGNSLAADTQCTFGCTSFKVSKIGRINKDVIYGVVGNLSDCSRMLKWVKENHTRIKKKDGYPEGITGEGGEPSIIVVDNSDKRSNGPILYEYTRFGEDPIVYLDTHDYAWGSGADFARGYMYACKLSSIPLSAVFSVEVASLFDIYTNNRIEVLPLVPRSKEDKEAMEARRQCE